jgi:hypothetical protein
VAAAFPLVRGFAVGRTIFGEVARAWLAGEIGRRGGGRRDGRALCAAVRDLGRRGRRGLKEMPLLPAARDIWT